MQNLAGEKNCDEVITRELTRCRIPVEQIKRQDAEVPYSVIGKLNGFTFARAWYYYTVHGHVPLNVARELYADPIGATDIRVSGHCGCPAPAEPWVIWFDKATGKSIRSLKEKEECEKYVQNSQFMKKICEHTLATCLFSDHPEINGEGFIESYHIDSEAGLRLFADTIHKYAIQHKEFVQEKELAS